MGDHRASIKIEMEFHGISDKMDMWINYSGNDSECFGVDDRIIKFFRDIFEKGMQKYHDEMVEWEGKRWREEIEAGEKAVLKRLKDKYELKEIK